MATPQTTTTVNRTWHLLETPRQNCSWDYEYFITAVGDVMNFRNWCQQKWFEHVDELESYRQPLPYTSQEYFAKYKFWLKREYRHVSHKGN